MRTSPARDSLDQGNGAVACGPAKLPCHGPAHEHRADGGTDAPHTMKPAHVAAGKMESHIIIEGSIDASCAQSVGDGPETEHGKGSAH